LHSNNGGEYVDKDFTNFCAKEGIKREWTTPYNPDQNGVAQRKNRTIVEAARAMMYGQDMPKFLWQKHAARQSMSRIELLIGHWARLLQSRSSLGRHLKLVIFGYLGV